MRFRFVFAVALLSVALLAAPCSAQNLLTNPSFDAGTSGWSNPYIDRIDWISNDGNPAGSGPGCLEIADTQNNGGCTGAIQGNITVVPDTMYMVSGFARLPAGSVAVAAAIWVEWYNAGGGYISSSQFNYVTSTVDGPWTFGSSLVASPPTAVEAWVRPSFCMPSSGTEESVARWDDLYFGPLAELVFADGFENGDTGAWSATVP